jgi:hypothetical protein
VTAKDILLAVIIPLALAELGPWWEWLAARLLPLAAKLRYGSTERAAIRLTAVPRSFWGFESRFVASVA